MRRALIKARVHKKPRGLAGAIQGCEVAVSNGFNEKAGADVRRSLVK